MRTLIQIVVSIVLAAAASSARGQFYRPDCPDDRCGMPSVPPYGAQAYERDAVPRTRAPVSPAVSPPAAVKAAIVKVQNWISGGARFEGSGTLVAKGGGVALVVTCAHTFYDVDKSPGTPIVEFTDGSRYAGTILGVDHLLDVLVLAIREPAAEPLELADQAPSYGEPIYTLGYGGASGGFLAQRGQALEYVTRYGTRGEPGPPGANFVVTGASPQNFSGGPILDRSWKLCGVIYGTNGRQTDGVCLPRLRAFLDRWRARAQFRREHAPVFARPTAPVTPHRGQPQIIQQVAPPIVLVPAWRESSEAAAKLEHVSRENARLTGELDRGRQAFQAAAARLEELQRLAQQQAQGSASDPPRIPPATKNQEPAISPQSPVPKFGTPDFGRLAERAASTFLRDALVGAGIASPVASLVTWFLVRRARQRVGQLFGRPENVREKVRVIREPAPPAPMTKEEVHHTQFVEVPEDKQAAAWARAVQIYGERYPGAVLTLEAVERLKDQIMAGQH